MKKEFLKLGLFTAVCLLFMSTSCTKEENLSNLEKDEQTTDNEFDEAMIETLAFYGVDATTDVAF